MPRPALPVDILEFRGRSKHLTKADKAERRKRELHLGGSISSAKIPPEVRRSKAARAKWREVVGWYSDSGLSVAEVSDSGVLARYCITHGQYLELVESQSAFVNPPAESECAAMPAALRMDNYRKLQREINRLLTALNQMEDRLFLNPQARCKNVLKRDTAEPEADPLQKAGFGSV